MYFPDLTPHRYSSSINPNKTYSIGWLEAGHDFTVGECPDEFIERLFVLCQYPVEMMWGYHLCDLCPSMKGQTQEIFAIHKGGIDLSLGTGEIHVRGVDDKSYRAPTLIYHYVVSHQYLPPPEFIEAVFKIDLTKLGFYLLDDPDESFFSDDPDQNSEWAKVKEIRQGVRDKIGTQVSYNLYHSQAYQAYTELCGDTHLAREASQLDDRLVTQLKEYAEQVMALWHKETYG